MKPKRKGYSRKKIKVLPKMSVPTRVHRENMMVHPNRVHPFRGPQLALGLPLIGRAPINMAQAPVAPVQVELTNNVPLMLHRIGPELTIPTIKAWIGSQEDEGWTKIGEKTVNLSKDRDEVTISGSEKFLSIKIKVSDAAMIDVEDVEGEL